MYIPQDAAPLNSTSNAFTINLERQSRGISGNWDSLVGIVTAICGNIIISFALNTQRYAHIRLSRTEDGEREKKQQESHQEPTGQHRNYGTDQEQIAEQRARENARPIPEGDLEEEEEEELGGESSERDPLVPAITLRRATSPQSSYRSQDKEDPQPQKNKSYLRSPIWWLGISLMVVGEAGNFLAYGFAPASIVSPLGVVALISNCIIAPLLLHEQFRWRDALGVVIAVGGCVTVVLSASDSNPKLDPDDIWDLISRWEFETYLGITIFLIIALAFLSNKYGDRTVLIDLGLVALFGGYTALSTKGVASLLSNTIWRVVTFPISYILVAVLVSTAVLQIKYLNRALQHFNSTIVIPTQFVLFTISVIVGSAVLYRDFERRSAADAVKFLGGCALTFLGVWCITSGRGEAGEEEEASVSEEEEDGVDLVDEEGVQPEIREHDAERKHSLISDGGATMPHLRRLSTADAIQRSKVIPSTPPQKPSLDPSTSFHLDNQPWNLSAGPANRAAIHASSASNLPSEPRKQNSSPKPPPMHATTSAPTIPTLDPMSSPRPRTPLSRHISHISGPQSPSAPRTPNRQTSSADPQNPLDPSPHKLLNRPSMIGLLPGPLTSPLSSSLSAIVADSLRRGVDSPYPSVRRRSMRSRPNAPPQSSYNQTGKRNSVSGAAASGPKRHSIASGEMEFEPATPTPLEERSQSNAESSRPSLKGGRGRSLSATLGEMFYQPFSKRQRTDAGGEEEGRS